MTITPLLAYCANIEFDLPAGVTLGEGVKDYCVIGGSPELPEASDLIGFAHTLEGWYNVATHEIINFANRRE